MSRPSGLAWPQTPTEFRAFVLAHHPDRGGDPDVFSAGVSSYRRRRPPEVVFYRRRRGLDRLMTPDRGGRALVHLLLSLPAGARRRLHFRRERA